jgi:hypothetical protein
MCAGVRAEPKQVLEALRWVGEIQPDADAQSAEWQQAAVRLFDALQTALAKLDAAGVCRGCGKPLGAYCLECAWPNKRRSERRSSG